jgi:hypothetical protein
VRRDITCETAEDWDRRFDILNSPSPVASASQRNGSGNHFLQLPEAFHEILREKEMNQKCRRRLLHLALCKKRNVY